MSKIDTFLKDLLEDILEDEEINTIALSGIGQRIVDLKRGIGALAADYRLAMMNTESMKNSGAVLKNLKTMKRQLIHLQAEWDRLGGDNALLEQDENAEE